MSMLNRKYSSETETPAVLRKLGYQPPADGGNKSAQESQQGPPPGGQPPAPLQGPPPGPPPGAAPQGPPPGAVPQGPPPGPPPGGAPQGPPPGSVPPPPGMGGGMPPEMMGGMPPGMGAPEGEMAEPVQVDASVLDEAIEKAVQRGMEEGQKTSGGDGSGETGEEASEVIRQLKNELDDLKSQVASLQDTPVEESSGENSDAGEDVDNNIGDMFTEEAQKSAPAGVDVSREEKVASEGKSLMDRWERNYNAIYNREQSGVKDALLKQLRSV